MGCRAELLWPVEFPQVQCLGQVVDVPCSCCSLTVMGVTAIMQRLRVSAGGASDSVIARVVGLQCAQRHGLSAGFGDEGVGAHHTGDELN